MCDSQLRYESDFDGWSGESGLDDPGYFESYHSVREVDERIYKAASTFHKVLTAITKPWEDRVDFTEIWSKWRKGANEEVFVDATRPWEYFQPILTEANIAIIDYLQIKLDQIKDSMDQEVYENLWFDLESAKQEILKDSRNSKEFARLYRNIEVGAILPAVERQKATVLKKEREEREKVAKEVDKKRAAACIREFEKFLLGLSYLTKEKRAQIIKGLIEKLEREDYFEVRMSIERMEDALDNLSKGQRL